MLAPDALLYRPDSCAHARPLRLHLSARLGAHQEYPFVIVAFAIIVNLWWFRGRVGYRRLH